MKWDRKVPFQTKTIAYPRRLVNYSYQHGDTSLGFEWIDNYEFVGTLVYVGYERSGALTHLNFKVLAPGNPDDGLLVSMFMIDFDEIVRSMVDGRVSGKWTFTKRGHAYGVKRA